MFKHYFERIENIEIWPVIALAIFFTFFIGLLIWVYKADNKHIDKMKGLPLDDAIDSAAINKNSNI